jgi:hypothetical protein
MALPPSAHLDARLHAPYHVQVERDTTPVAHAASVPDSLQLQWRVTRVFRGDGRLKKGDVLRFAVKLDRGGAAPDDGARLRLADLATLRFVEAFLEGTPPDMRVTAGQLRPISVCSDRPQMDVSTEPEIESMWKVLQRWISGRPARP